MLRAIWFWNSTTGRLLCDCCLPCNNPANLKNGNRPKIYEDKPMIYKNSRKCNSTPLSTVPKWETCRQKCLDDTSCNFYEVDENLSSCRIMADCSKILDSENTTIYYKLNPEFIIPDTPMDDIEGSGEYSDTDDEDMYRARRGVPLEINIY